jgi:serine/threonine protein kinase
MASITHESLVVIFQVGQDRDVVYLAMELLEGESLSDWISNVRRPKLSVVLRVGREIADGLAAIHRGGLIHRDLKPSNIWMGKNGRVKILDFGLARFVHEDDELTEVGSVLGTPCFMSPEQARAEAVDFRCDLFSLGCVLYNLCSGKSPFHSNNVTAALTALATQNPKPLRERNPAIPRELSNLVAQLLEKDPSRRPNSAEEVSERLREVEQIFADRGRRNAASAGLEKQSPGRQAAFNIPDRPYRRNAYI